jgi:hypothetical protein
MSISLCPWSLAMTLVNFWHVLFSSTQLSYMMNEPSAKRRIVRAIEDALAEDIVQMTLRDPKMSIKIEVSENLGNSITWIRIINMTMGGEDTPRGFIKVDSGFSQIFIKNDNRFSKEFCHGFFIAPLSRVRATFSDGRCIVKTSADYAQEMVDEYSIDVPEGATLDVLIDAVDERMEDDEIAADFLHRFILNVIGFFRGE